MSVECIHRTSFENDAMPTANKTGSRSVAAAAAAAAVTKTTRTVTTSPPPPPSPHYSSGHFAERNAWTVVRRYYVQMGKMENGSRRVHGKWMGEPSTQRWTENNNTHWKRFGFELENSKLTRTLSFTAIESAGRKKECAHPFACVCTHFDEPRPAHPKRHLQ